MDFSVLYIPHRAEDPGSGQLVVKESFKDIIKPFLAVFKGVFSVFYPLFGFMHDICILKRVLCMSIFIIHYSFFIFPHEYIGKLKYNPYTPT